MAGASDIQVLVDDVAKLKDVKDSVVTTLNGFAQRLDDAIKEALAEGATKEQLAPLTQLHEDITSYDDEMAAAVLANTPAEPGPVVGKKKGKK